MAGQALVADTGVGCESGGNYAKIRDIRANANWYDGVIALAVAGSDTILLAPSASKAVEVYAVYSNGTSRKADPSKLTYTITEGTATGLTVSNAGVVTAGATEGTGSLNVKITGKEAVAIDATVTVAE